MSLVRTSLRGNTALPEPRDRGRGPTGCLADVAPTLPGRFPYVRPSAAVRQLGRRVLWDSLPVLPAGGARHQHSTEQLRQSATVNGPLANRAEEGTPGATMVKRGRPSVSSGSRRVRRSSRWGSGAENADAHSGGGNHDSSRCGMRVPSTPVLDRRDAWHTACRRLLKSRPGPLLVPTLAIAELLRTSRRACSRSSSCRHSHCRDAESGRGLLPVDALADGWGVPEDRFSRKCVWAELRRPGTEPPPRAGISTPRRASRPEPHECRGICIHRSRRAPKYSWVRN